MQLFIFLVILAAVEHLATLQIRSCWNYYSEDYISFLTMIQCSPAFPLFLLITLRISLTRLLTSATPWLINAHTIFLTCFPCSCPFYLKEKYFILRIKSTAHQGIFLLYNWFCGMVYTILVWDIPWWIICTSLMHQPQKSTCTQVVGATAAYWKGWKWHSLLQDGLFHWEIKNPQHQLRCWDAEAGQKFMKKKCLTAGN